MATKAPQLPANFSADDLKKAIAKHGADKLFPLKVTKDGKVYSGIFKKPTLVVMSAAAAAGANDPLRSGEVLYTNCKIAADAEMDTDEEVHLAAIGGVNKLFKVLEAEVGEAFAAE